jgi:hypothetical protein
VRHLRGDHEGGEPADLVRRELRRLRAHGAATGQRASAVSAARRWSRP